MTISLDLNHDDTALVEKYAKLQGISVSEFVLQSVIQRIEDEYDRKLFEKAKEEFEKNPVTYSFEEVRLELGL